MSGAFAGKHLPVASDQILQDLLRVVRRLPHRDVQVALLPRLRSGSALRPRSTPLPAEHARDARAPGGDADAWAYGRSGAALDECPAQQRQSVSLRERQPRLVSPQSAGVTTMVHSLGPTSPVWQASRAS